MTSLIYIYIYIFLFRDDDHDITDLSHVDDCG